MGAGSPLSEVPDAPDIADIKDAASRIKGYAVYTPLMESPAINALAGGRVLIKAEMLQRTGAFKFRGAWNRISRLSGDELKRGVVTYSSGNHGQAVAAAASLLGAPATIVMPADAPSMKTESTRRHGATIRPYDRETESREDICREIADRNGAVIVPPFDDPLIIAGQGTVGLEIAAQTALLDAKPDMALVPCSGGGLVAGCAIALTEYFPDIAIHTVEPDGFDDMARSLVSGRRETNHQGAKSFCDALLVQTPGRLTFDINSRLLAGGLAVSDEDTARAMAAAFAHLKLVAEPGGAIALAAVLSGAIDCRGKTVAVVCSGGNVDSSLYAKAIR
ncbi:MAG: threonine/serine dehydratase [Rhodospirillales bacterium]|nr:threonine/serine dehydratase [Rhodospirillales bacterium]